MACVTSPSRSLKWICIIIISVLMFELVVFNFFILYGYIAVRNTLGPFMDFSGDMKMVDGIKKMGWAQNLVQSGKSGGFISVLQNTLERLFVIIPRNKNNEGPEIASFSLDMSHSGEFLFIYKRMLSQGSKGYAKLVIDVGANDGLLSSNSFNLIQLGWNALLVEPLNSQAKMAKQNLDRYVNPYKDQNQTVKVIQSVLSDQDGTVKFAVAEDIASMEGYVLPRELEGYKVVDHHLISVNSMTVKTFTHKYSVPKFFGLLSIDAEGAGNQILHEFIGLGFRPAFIIYEDIHERSLEHPDQTKVFLASVGYRYLTRRGWNLIFEFGRKK